MSETSVITKYRREKLCQITSGAISTLAPVTHIAFGKGGVDSDGAPVAPLDTATSLSNEIARYPIDKSPEYPVPTTARYEVTIPAGELAGALINEAGLVDGDGGLCAVKTFLTKGKDNGVTFTFTFDDEF
jgi:hypothetical protein